MAELRIVLTMEVGGGPVAGKRPQRRSPCVAPLSAAIATAGRPYVLRDAPTQSEEVAVKYFTPDLIARGQ